MSELPPRSRLVVSVTEIRRRPGTRLDIDRTLEAAGLDLSVTEVGVPDGSEIGLRGEVESIHEGVVLTGRVTVPWVGRCRRCLRDVEGEATAEVREVFERRPVEGETWPLDQDHIDIGPLLHDTALLALPLAPLCQESCLGPAPEAFPAVVEAQGSSTETSVRDDGGTAASPPKDPRWAALDDLDL